MSTRKSRLACSLVCDLVFTGCCTGCFTGCCTGCFTGCNDCPQLKQKWPAMILTVTWTPVSRVGHLMYVNNYYGHWDFPGPVLQFPGHFISFLLGWSHGLTSTVCSKSSNVVWAVLHKMLRFRAICLNESSIAIHCRQLSNEGQANTLTCILVQQTS